MYEDYQDQGLEPKLNRYFFGAKTGTEPEKISVRSSDMV